MKCAHCGKSPVGFFTHIYKHHGGVYNKIHQIILSDESRLDELDPGQIAFVVSTRVMVVRLQEGFMKFKAEGIIEQ